MQTLIPAAVLPATFLTGEAALAKSYDGGAPTAGLRGRIPEIGHEFRPREHGAHHLALHADAAPVNNAESPEAGLVRFQQVLLYDALDIARGHAVKVESIADGNPNRLDIGIFCHQKSKSPASRSQPGDYRYCDCAHPILSDVLGSILGHDRFHLIFQPEFHLLQTSLF
jgi:hypothetical protein